MPKKLRVYRIISVLCLSMCLMSLGAKANNFYVTNLNDAGAGSLRQAILDANSMATGLPHTVIFNVAGTIVVTSSGGLPQITSPGLTIDGLNQITLNTTGGDIAITFFDINASNVTIRNLNLLNTGGNAVQVEANTTGVTIQNIVANNYNANWINYIVYVAGASNGLTLQNIRSWVGLQNGVTGFYFAGGRQSALKMDRINLTTNMSSGYATYGIYFNATPLKDFTLSNSRISGVTHGIYMAGASTDSNVVISNLTLDSLWGGGYGLYTGFISNGVTIRKALFNVNNSTAYGLRFDNKSKDVTIDSLVLHGSSNSYSCYFSTGTDTNIVISHSSFDNLKGGTANQCIRFDQPVTNLTMTADTIDESIANSTGSGAYGLVFMAAVANANLDSLIINKASVDGMLVNSSVNGFTVNHSKFTGNAIAVDMPANIAHAGVSVLNSSFLNGTNASAGAFQFYAGVLPQQFSFKNDTVSYNAGSGLRAYSGAVVVTDTITRCVITNNGTFGVFMDNAPQGVVIKNNSIYNNASGGIGMTGNGNCAYTGANRPTIVSSTPMGGGQYQLQITTPNIVPGASYDLDIYANDAGVSAASGQYYVTTITGVTFNNNVPVAYIVNYNTGPGATGRGFWTATLRIPANTCGTSAFSNQVAMSPLGPAGVNNGVVAWLRADDGQANGSFWGDYSGNGAGAFQSTATNQPAIDTAGLNYNPGLLFNGSNKFMQIPNSAITTLFPAGNSPRTMITVGTKTGTGTGVTFAYGVPTTYQGNGQAVTNQQPYYFGYGNDMYGTTTGIALGRQAIIATTYNNPTASLYINGLPNGSGNFPLWSTGTTGNGYIGQTTGGGGAYWSGDIGEVIVYNRVLSSTELQQVCSYLGLKYGITADSGKLSYLASDGSAYWTANSTYKYRITGVGRDNVTGLYQKQSLNIDSGTVILSLGSSVAISNAVNTSVIGADKSFLTFADNNGAIGLTTAVTASGAKSNQRMGRVWMVQKTANWTNQLVTLRILGGGINNYLLISSDPAFATIGQELQLDAGGNVTLNSSLLANGAYFTVGASLRGPAGVNSGIALWLRADDGQSTGGQWNDYSGNANGAVQSITAKQPAVINNAFNFGRGLRFNGSTQNLSVSYSPAFNGNVTVYSVYRQANASSYQTPISSRGLSVLSGWNYYINYNSSNRREWQTGYAGGWDVQVDGTYTNKQPEFIGLTAMTGAGNASKNMYLNGVPLGTATTNSNYTSNTNGPVLIGSVDQTNYFWNGDIAEAVIYNRVLNSTERQQVESYLGLKYGITLNNGLTNYLASDGSTIFWDVTANAGYVKHVTGIGRDSATGLYQKQSLSVDTGYVTLALGSAVAAANELNTAAISADKSFLVVGDNNGGKTFINNINLPGVTFLTIGRKWKVQKTNWTDQSITMATDTTQPLPQDLLISTDPTFATGVTVLPMTKGVVTFNSSQLASGVYFTFADTLRGPGGVNTGIGAWWRADAGGSVSAWTDYSGNGRTQTQTTTTLQPALQPSVINFNPALNFNGDYMTSPSVFGTGSIQYSSYFTVTLPSNGAEAEFGESISGGMVRGYSPYSGGTVYFDAQESYRIGGAWGKTYGNPYLFAYTRWPAGTSMDASVNDSSVATRSGTIPNYFGNNQPFYLGAQSPSYMFIGQIAEMIVYNNTAAMTALDRQKIMSYLAFKYGLTLSPMRAGGYVASNGVSFWNDGTNTGYNRHITGVGRDSASGLYQRQSVSADTGVVTLALGNTIAASNAANMATISADRSFFVFGDNGAATTYLTDLTSYPGLTTRMTRVFKVQKTNWTDQVVTMKIRGATNKTYLIVSNDPTFASFVSAYAFTDSTIQINTNKLGNGAYFSFARLTPAPNGVSNGLVLWLRADDGTVNGAQWNDQTSNGLNAVQATPANQPTLDAKAINFNYGVQFNGSSTSMQIPYTTMAGLFPFGNSPRTMISVASKTGTGNGGLLGYGTAGTYTGNGLYVYNQTPGWYGYGNDVNGSATAYPLNQQTIIGGTYNYVNTTTAPATLYINGLSNATGNYPNWNTSATANAYVGAVTGGGAIWSGAIGEVILYNRALTSTEMQQVCSYLGLKYGITADSGRLDYLASDGSTYWTANSSYKYRITGIGRDDSTQLYTKQSLNADTGFVTLSLGSSVALTNQTNTATITNNRSFFVFADNAGSVNNFSAAVSGSSNGVTLRYARVWRVQKTNWADQNITLKVKPTGLNNYLLISSDPNFGSVTSELLIKSDSTVTFNTSLFNGGNIYFSFGAPMLAPGGVAGHSLWLRADLGSSSKVNGTQVSQWNDQSAFANNVVQATPANQPVYVDNSIDNINFNPVMKFNGSSSYLAGGSMFKTGIYKGTAAFVVNNANPSNSSIVYESFSGGALDVELPATSSSAYWSGTATISYAPTGGYPFNQAMLWTDTYDATIASNNMKIYQNGVFRTQGGANTAGYTGNNSAVNIGRFNYSNSYLYKGTLPEVIIYNMALTSTQLQQVNSYLSIKYGLTQDSGRTSYLATDGIPVWNADPVYKWSITGIGRDSVEGLMQLQSRNSDTTRLRIVMGLGEIDSTNSANSNQFGADRSYLIWGDDNGSAGFTTAVTGLTGLNYRMVRTWKVQERGSVGNVQVAIPFNALPNPASAVLLVSNTPGVFDGTSTVYKLKNVITIAGVKHYAATVNFANGQFFTFAANVKAPGGVAGTTLWLRADEGTSSSTDGVLINTWADFGNQVNTVYQNAPANQPVFGDNAKDDINFNPVLKFVGGNDFMTGVSMLKSGSSNKAAAFGVSNMTAATNSALFYETGSSGSLFMQMWSNGYNYWQAGNSNASYAYGTITNQSIIWTGTYDGTLGSNNLSFYQNGIFRSSGNSTAGYTGNNSPLYIGQYPGYGNYNGRIPELIVYTGALNATQQKQVNSYLSIKYGITLNNGATDYLSTDSTIKVWTANATYKYSIAGIGYDTTESLLQLQSRNSDTTRLRIAIGLGEIDSTNSANANSFGADRSYLMWGDDNGSAGFTTPVSGLTGLNYRMTRTWKVQETGSVGSVQIAIPFNALPSPKTGVLLVSNTGTFDGTSTVYRLNQKVTIAGVLHYAVTVNLTNGQFFTFAANVKAPGGVAGTSLWLRADEGTSSSIDGTTIDTWTDYGNEVNSVFQLTTASQPRFLDNATDNINFNPVLKFDGGDFFTGTSMLKTNTSNGAAAFGVSNLTTATASALFYETGSSGSLFMQMWNNGNNYWQAGNSSAAYAYGTINNQTMLWTGTYDGTLGSNNLSFYQNGIFRSPGNSTAGYTGNNSPLYIGQYPGYGNYNGRIPELAVYTKALTATQRDQVNTYMAIKYGITLNNGQTAYLATDGTTIWNTDAVYKNSITGIGFDSTEDLLQKQSRNSDTTRLQIAVGLGEIDSTNNANPNTFTADRSYLVWGDDNGFTTFQTTVSGNPDVNYRMGRTWKAQVTGTVGNVVVAFPYDVLPNPAQSYLVVSNNLVFDGTDTYIPLTKMTVGGKQHWGATVSLTGTRYFTVAAFVKSPGGVGLTQLWLRPDKGIVAPDGVSQPMDGQAVNVWVDFANQVNNASQGNILNQPSYRQNAGSNINFNPVMQFASSSSQYMSLDVTKLPTGTIGRTIFGMGKLSAAPSTYGYLITWGNNTTYQGSGMAYSTTGQGTFLGYANDVTTTANFWQNGVFNEQMNIWAGTASGSGASIYSKRKLIAGPQTMSSWNTGSTGARLGGTFWGSNEYWNGTAGDVIVFGRQLNTNEILRVETYLAIRYGYTLDTSYLRTDNAIVWNAPANPTYKYNIAGIGRDDVEGLNQLQSRSINAASIMTIGLGGIAVDNLSNTNAFAKDTSYVMWGSNSTSATTQTTGLPAGTVYNNGKRMVQQWKMELTNFDNSQQPLSVAFDLTGFTYTDTGANNLVLLVDNDGDGNFTTGAVQRIPSTYYSSVARMVRFDNVTTLPDGAVITLGFIKNSLQLNAKVYLQGAWNGTSMKTTLKTGGLLPATDPYGLGTTPSVRPNSAAAQVVDWVRVELRDPVAPTTVVASRAALLLADGSIVDTNYTQPLVFPVPTTSYYVVIKHRNHLGVMTGAAVDFSSGTGTVDFTSSGMAAYTRPNSNNPAQTVLGNGAYAMWGGDANGDGKISYLGTGNDANAVYNALGNNYLGYMTGYFMGDVNLDGQMYYLSTDNDVDWILYYPLGGNPNQYLEAQLP